MDITAASVMLGAGSVLQIDVVDIEPLIEREFQLFKGELSTCELNGAVMVSADGRSVIDDEEGASGKDRFVIKGIRGQIPEPSTLSLGLAALAGLVMRRRR